MLFLGVEPYSLLPWYNQLVWKPFLEGRESAMVSLFSKILWRSSKADVAKEVRREREREMWQLDSFFLSPAWTAWTNRGATLVIVQLCGEVLLPQTARDLLQGPEACCLGTQRRHCYPLLTPKLDREQGVLSVNHYHTVPFQLHCTLTYACVFLWPLYTPFIYLDFIFLHVVDASPSLSEASLLPSLDCAKLLLASQHQW